jgi:hypothetical protein
MNTKDIPQEILDHCSKITRKRAKTVVDHIIEHGFITTEQLQTDYGYDHPPRAARDVREEGVPLVTFKVVSERTGRKIGAYKFGDPSKIKKGRFGGRKAFSKKFKDDLLEKYGSRDAVSGEEWEDRYLQIDHRIPYEIGGDEGNGENNLDLFMLLHGTSQRAKSWSCEHCDNFIKDHNVETCQSCYWAFPENYTHVAMKEVRMVSIEWIEKEVGSFDRLTKIAAKKKLSVQTIIKEILNSYTESNDA